MTCRHEDIRITPVPDFSHREPLEMIAADCRICGHLFHIVAPPGSRIIRDHVKFERTRIQVRVAS